MIPEPPSDLTCLQFEHAGTVFFVYRDDERAAETGRGPDRNGYPRRWFVATLPSDTWVRSWPAILELFDPETIAIAVCLVPDKRTARQRREWPTVAARRERAVAAMPPAKVDDLLSETAPAIPSNVLAFVDSQGDEWERHPHSLDEATGNPVSGHYYEWAHFYDHGGVRHFAGSMGDVEPEDAHTPLRITKVEAA